MASKYASLKGKIPELPRESSEREKAIAAEIIEFGDQPFEWLTATFNSRRIAKDRAEEAVEQADIKLEAVQRAILSKLDTESLDAIKANDYTWSGKTEPYPVVEDNAKLVAHFIDNHQEDMLTMHWMRLKGIVREEALANELVIEEKTIVDQQTGKEITYNDVRSQIPGVRVFLKPSLSRVKSGK